MKGNSQQHGRGFLLLEMILALAVFAMAVTGFVVALHKMSRVSGAAQSEMRVTRILDSAMSETMSLPELEPGQTSYPVEGTNFEIVTLIEEVEDLQSEEGLDLDNILRVRITARWFEDGLRKERSAETWRYEPMYEP